MDYSNQEAYKVGKKQKAILWCILASTISFFIPDSSFIVAIVCIVFVYQLAAAEKSSVAWLWALLQLMPFVSLICLLILNQKATKILKEKNIKVGLMGANNKDLEKLIIKKGLENEI